MTKIQLKLKIKLLLIGKTDEAWLREGISDYIGRIKHYVPFSVTEVPSGKDSRSVAQQVLKLREAELLLKHISGSDYVVLLDEHGPEMRSVEFAGFLNRHFNTGNRTLVFVAGGPFGFDESLRKRAQMVLSLSKMTFSHQMVRLFFTEQLYRALTILRGESYHHE